MYTSVFGDSQAVTCFAVAMLVVCLGSALCLAGFSYRNREWPGFSRSIATVSALLYTLAQIGFLFGLAYGLAPFFLVLLGALSGASLIPLALSWVRGYFISIRSVMFHGALVCLLSALLTWVLSQMPSTTVALIVAALVVLGAWAPVACHFDASEFPAAESREHIGSAFSSIRDLTSVIWLPLLGFLLCLFVSSVYSFSIVDGVSSEFVGALTVSFIILMLCVLRFKTPLAILIEKLIVPGIVAVCLVLRSFPFGSFLFYAGAMSVYVPMMFLSVYTLVLLVAVSEAGEFPCPFIFGTAFFTAVLVILLGTALLNCPVFSEDPGSVLWLFICVYFAVIVLNLGYTAWRRDSVPRDTADVDDPTMPEARTPDEYRRQHVERVAAEKGLTKREQELLEYMSRGHGSSFIADVLFISRNTARTHIRNIYRKLGVTSREELILMIDDDTRDQK
jgi:DNA-binding CsgD family transcriptional regulator